MRIRRERERWERREREITVPSTFTVSTNLSVTLRYSVVNLDSSNGNIYVDGCAHEREREGQKREKRERESKERGRGNRKKRANAIVHRYTIVCMRPHTS
jgi:hypothetical protein